MDTGLRGIDLIDQSPFDGALPVCRVIHIEWISKINFPPGSTCIARVWELPAAGRHLWRGMSEPKTAARVFACHCIKNTKYKKNNQDH